MANGEIKKRRRQQAQFGPVGLGADPIGSITGTINLLGELLKGSGQQNQDVLSALAGGVGAASFKGGEKLGEEVARELTPQEELAEGQIKVAKKFNEDAAKQELESGAVTAEQMMEQAKQISGGAGGGGGLNQALTGQPKQQEESPKAQQPQQAESKGDSNISDILQTLLTVTTGFATPGATRTFAKARAEGKASVTGDTAEAKRQAATQKRQDEFFKSINQPLTTAKELSQVESAITGIDNITRLLDISTDENGNVSVGNSKLLRNKNFLSQNRQELKRARDAFINKALRRDTGAAIGKKEEEDFRKTFGFEIGMKSFLQNPDVIAKSLIESRDQFLRDRSRLSPNESTRSMVSDLRNQGFKDPEIFAAFERRGIV